MKLLIITFDKCIDNEYNYSDALYLSEVINSDMNKKFKYIDKYVVLYDKINYYVEKFKKSYDYILIVSNKFNIENVEDIKIFISENKLATISNIILDDNFYPTLDIEKCIINCSFILNEIFNFKCFLVDHYQYNIQKKIPGISIKREFKAVLV